MLCSPTAVTTRDPNNSQGIQYTINHQSDLKSSVRLDYFLYLFLATFFIKYLPKAFVDEQLMIT